MINQLFRAKTLKDAPLLRFPSGRDADEVKRLFEAANRCIQQSRQEGQPIPLDPTLADFEISDGESEKLELKLRPIAPNRHYQSPNQDQAALGRLLYEIIIGQLLVRNDSERALNRLAGTDLSEPPSKYAYPRLAAIIRQALLNQFYSLNEMNGALGFALYQENQNFARSQRHLLNATAEMLPEEAEEFEAVSKRRSANIGLLFGLIVLCLITLIGLAALSAQKDSTSKQQANQTANVLPTFTPNPTNNKPDGLAGFDQNANNSQISSSDGILHREFSLTDSSGQPSPLNELKIGQASLLSQPALAVTGANWNADNNTVSVALNDGEYRVYDYTTSKVIAGQVFSDDGNTLATCWSPNGKYYVNFTIDSNVIFHDLVTQTETKGAIPAIANALVSTVTAGSLNTDCASTVTWSPNNQAALLRNYGWNGSDATEQYWVINAKGLVAVDNQPSFSPYSCGIFYNKPIWSPDSSQFAMLTVQNTNKSNLYFEVHGANTGLLDYSAEINNSNVGCDATSKLLSNVAWLPDNSIARLIETPVGKFGIYSATLAIFAVPRAREVTSSPSLTITDESRSDLGANYGLIAGIAFSQNTQKLAFVALPAETDAKNQYSPYNTKNPKRYLVIYRRVSNDANSKWIDWADLNLADAKFYPRQVFLSWNSDGNEILGSDGLGDIGIWFGASFGPVTPPTNAKLMYSPLVKNTSETNLVSNYYDWSPDGNALLEGDSSGLRILNPNSQQPKLQFSADITVPNMPNFNFTIGVDSSSDRSKIKLGQWSPDGKFYAARVSAHLSNQPQGQTPAYLGVWKLDDKGLEFDGLIQLGDIHANVANNNWTFDAQKPIIYVVGVSGKKVSYDLTNPIPDLDKQPSLGDTAKSNTKSADFFDLSFQSEALDSILDWSLQADTIINDAGSQVSINSMQSSKTVSLTASGYLSIAAFSSNGKLVALGESSGNVRIVEVATGKIITDISAAQSKLTALQFSPDNRWLVTGASDRQIKIWQVSQDSYWPLLQVLQGQIAAITQVAFSPDSHYLLTNDANDMALIWRLR